MPRALIPPPENLPEKAKECTNGELSALYGVCKDTVTKWRKRFGVPAPRRRRKTGARKRVNVDTLEEIAMYLRCKQG